MKLSEVVNDFGNVAYNDNEEKQQHLYRRQAAKCHAMNLFILQLAKKFPDWWKSEGHGYWTDHPTKEWELNSSESFPHDTSRWFLPVSGSNITTREIKRAFEAKYDAMRRAKFEFEDAGGKYPPKR
jgi:hypothetical protein